MRPPLVFRILAIVLIPCSTMPLRKATAYSPFVPSRLPLPAHPSVNQSHQTHGSDHELLELSKALKEADHEMITGCREDLDTLLVFVRRYILSATV